MVECKVVKKIKSRVKNRTIRWNENKGIVCL